MRLVEFSSVLGLLSPVTELNFGYLLRGYNVVTRFAADAVSLLRQLKVDLDPNLHATD